MKIIDLGSLQKQGVAVGHGEWKLHLEAWIFQSIQRELHQNRQGYGSRDFWPGRESIKSLEADILISLLFQNHLDLVLQVGQVSLGTLLYFLTRVEKLRKIEGAGGQFGYESCGDIAFVGTREM
ncbi:hypothetical protein ACFFLM_05740 [Deinococcus oregonensis]|uniref:Uncharacterized protein n=1 Tax=Deinococcus oregonensis TaxID=1805970 RepID=A0ABV6AVE9_9DEIO